MEKCENCTNVFHSSLIEEYSNDYETRRLCLGCKEYEEYNDWSRDVDRIWPKSDTNMYHYFIPLVIIITSLYFFVKIYTNS